MLAMHSSGKENPDTIEQFDEFKVDGLKQFLRDQGLVRP